MKASIYQPWQIDQSLYPDHSQLSDQIKFMLGYAILAPSSFNSQAWLCKLEESRVLIYINYQKMPQKSDKQGRFGFISVGCFLENLLIASGSFGWTTEVKLNSRMSAKDNLVATVTYLRRSSDQMRGDDLQSMIKRATNRSLSQKYRLSKNQQGAMKRLIEQGVNMQIVDAQELPGIVALSHEADLRIWSDKDFREEHVEWVRSNITRKPDGMPGFGVGVGLIPSLLSRPVILSSKFASLQAKKNQEALLSSANYLVLTSADAPSSWVAVGQTFQRLNLYLVEQGLVAAPMGQFIEDAKARLQLQGIIKSKQAPQLFMRINKPSLLVRHSPRRSVGDIIINQTKP